MECELSKLADTAIFKCNTVTQSSFESSLVYTTQLLSIGEQTSCTEAALRVGIAFRFDRQSV